MSAGFPEPCIATLEVMRSTQSGDAAAGECETFQCRDVLLIELFSHFRVDKFIKQPINGGDGPWQGCSRLRKWSWQGDTQGVSGATFKANSSSDLIVFDECYVGDDETYDSFPFAVW